MLILQSTAQPVTTTSTPSVTVESTEIGLIAVAIIPMIVSVVRGIQKSWEANSEVIDDLRKQCNDLEEKLADSETEIFKLTRRNKSLEKALDYSTPVNHSSYMGEQENVKSSQF